MSGSREILCRTCGMLFHADDEDGMAHAQAGHDLTRVLPDAEQAFEALRAAAGGKLDGLDVEAHRRAVWGEGE
jgi:hypothetical protein